MSGHTKPDERQGTLWTLHISSEGEFELYVSCLLGPAFGTNQTSMSESFKGDRLGEALDSARKLYAELAPRFPAPAPTRYVRGLAMKSVSRLHVTHIVHGWDTPPSPAQLRLTRETTEGPDQGSAHVDVDLDSLTATVRRSVAVLDELALVMSRRFIDEYATRMTGQPVPDAAPARRWRVFISYRRQDLDMAKTLHSALARYGEGAFFDPYLDEHDLAAGELETRLREAIDSSDLFVAVALADYAAPGSWTARELTYAVEVGSLIVPLLVADAEPQHWPEWKKRVAHRFASAEAIEPSSAEFGSFANMMLLGAEANPRGERDQA